MKARVRKVSEEEIQAQLRRIKRQEPLRTAKTDAATDEWVNSPAAAEEEDWTEHDESEPPYKKLKPWYEVLQGGELDEITLEPGSFLSDEDIRTKYLPYRKIKGKRKRIHRYYDHPERLTTEITRNTIFWYPAGKYHLDRPSAPHKGEIAGIYLRQVLSEDAQRKALHGLEQMKFPPPHRAETAPAIRRQRGFTTPGELLFGYTDFGTLEQTLTSREKDRILQLSPLEDLLKEMDGCFARTLPFYYQLQGSPKSIEERQAQRQKADALPEFGGIQAELRHFLTSFSNITLLRSCPSAIHKDQGNARKDQNSFTCLTSVGQRKKSGEIGFSGGAFCLIEYGIKIPVKPGDILIAQTTREWHYNVTPVKGVKYSIVCYYRRRLADPNLIPGKWMSEGTK